MASPTFALTDILIRGRQTNSQIIVSGVPSHRDKKYKDAWSQVIVATILDVWPVEDWYREEVGAHF